MTCGVFYSSFLFPLSSSSEFSCKNTVRAVWEISFCNSGLHQQVRTQILNISCLPLMTRFVDTEVGMVHHVGDGALWVHDTAWVLVRHIRRVLHCGAKLQRRWGVDSCPCVGQRKLDVLERLI
eukprot:TRINITY_DN67913_c0_g1_i12.p1 TRINITY_DN67913_c0_g1~~TRINITY_DN67913_c0_g1_i12.p1  ORF type:complete len:123 (-),score=6.65 TRINITY_DN67913_c0_g1_i12:101-469(-)